MLGRSSTIIKSHIGIDNKDKTQNTKEESLPPLPIHLAFVAAAAWASRRNKNVLVAQTKQEAGGISLSLSCFPKPSGTRKELIKALPKLQIRY